MSDQLSSPGSFSRNAEVACDGHSQKVVIFAKTVRSHSVVIPPHKVVLMFYDVLASFP